MINVVTLSGRLTADPKKSISKNGVAYTFFTLAVQKPFNNQGAVFISCSAWKNTAEAIERYCKKGSKVTINGYLDTMTRTSETGQTTNQLLVNVSVIEFSDTKEKTAEKQAPQNNDPFEDFLSEENF